MGNGLQDEKSVNNYDEKSALVSIIIPVYNTEKYFRYCLESVTKQSYRNLEIIIINDGSTDQCTAICNEYELKDKRIRVYHTENRGLSAARNLGIGEAKGKYVAFIDSDDWFELNAIEIMLRKIVEVGADIVCCGYYREYYGRQVDICEKAGNDKVLTGSRILKEYCTGIGIGSVVWNKIYSKKVFEEIRFPEGRYYEEYATTYKLLQKSELVVCIPNALIHYRVRKGSITDCHDFIHLNDQWWAVTKCHDDLALISKECGIYQLGMCVVTILRIWAWYPNFTKEEIKHASVLLESIRKFIDDHKIDILRSPYILTIYKVICISPKEVWPFLMKALYVANYIRKRFQFCHNMFIE